MNNAYISKAYLQEKWQNIQWAMNTILDNSETDKLDNDVVKRNLYAVEDNMQAVLNELHKGDE